MNEVMGLYDMNEVMGLYDMNEVMGLYDMNEVMGLYQVICCINIMKTVSLTCFLCARVLRGSS